MRALLLLMVALSGFTCSASAQNTEPDETYNFNIPSSGVEEALRKVARQTGHQILFSYELVEAIESPPVVGEYTLAGALQAVLKGTGLSGNLTERGVIIVTLTGAQNNTRERNDKMNTKKSILAAVMGVLFGAGVQGVVAQEQGGETSGRVLDEIIVTAEKREQSLQEVPVAISAFTADMLKARGIDTPQDLQLAVPGLMIGEQNNTGGTARVTIRGVGSENWQPGGDPGVPLHINGHYTQSTAYVFRDLIDIERVEVQRGPQGTLYGRNAVGGNINIITKRPTEEFEGSIGVEVGNYNKRQLQAIVSGPLSDNLRGRLVVIDAQRDGYVKDVGIVGRDRNTANYTSVRGALEFDVTDNVQLYLNAYHFDDKGNTYARRLDSNPSNIANTDPWKVRTNTPSEDSDKSKGVSIDLSWDLGDVEFRSLSAYDDTFKTSLLDTDNSDTESREFGFEIGYETLTQEFQLLSSSDGPMQWVTGLFYYKEKSDMLFDLKLTQFDTNEDSVVDDSDPRLFVVIPTDINATSLAAYGQLDYAITDRIELVAGLRYTKDRKDRFISTDRRLENGGSVALFGGSFLVPASFIRFDNKDGESWNEVTGKLGLNFYATEDVMLYASYSRGYKAGGYNSDQFDPYDPEYVDAYEAGMKSQWLDDRVQMNIATFYYQYKDKQDYQRFFRNGLSFFEILNASEATTYGAELEFQAYLTDAFFVDGSIGYINAEFDNFTTIDNSFPLDDPDRSGNKLPLSPEWKFNIGLQYDWALSGNGGSLSIRGDYVWVDDQYGNAFNRDGTNLLGDGDLIPAYHIANARLQWESADAAWLAQFYIRNITDKDSVSNVFVAGATDINVTHLAPRTYGLNLSYRF